MKVAIIGAGLMGGAVARKLKENSFDVIAYNRTKAKAAYLSDFGIELVDRPLDAINKSEVIILFLSDAEAIQSVVMKENILPAFKDKTVIQMGTILPEESKSFFKVFTENETEYFEAPVLGSIPQILGGNLIVMLGGTTEQKEKYYNLFSAFSKDIFFIGEVGKAAALKLALNNLIASHITAFSLSLGILTRENIEIETFMNILRKSALYAPTFDSKLPLMTKRDFSKANFPTKHLLKDVKLIEKFSSEKGLNTTYLNAIKSIIEDAIKNDCSEEDYSSIYKSILKQF